MRTLAILALGFLTACEFSPAERQAVLNYYTHSTYGQSQTSFKAERPDKTERPEKTDRPDTTPRHGPPQSAQRPIAGPAHPLPGEHALPGAPSCGGVSGAMCLGLKYIVYEAPGGDPIETDRDAIDGVSQVNLLWRECGIQFQIDHFQAIQPSEEQLRYRTANYGELDEIRHKFMDDRTLLVVMTGTWDRTGSLGSTYANAWTNMPGEEFFGSILEKPVSHDPNVLAHELGHYLSLGHVRDPLGLMSPIIYSNSTRLTSEECESARWAAHYFWKKMIR